MRTLAAVLLMITIPASGLSWGETGHRMINRLAIEAASPLLPQFMNERRSNLIYNSFEPDRWRREADSPMNIAQAPDHFINSEYWGPLGTIASDRYAFMEAVAEKNVDLVRMGYLPYSILEMYGRLRNAFRHLRAARMPEDREAVMANATIYAGILGHYVGDGASPLHLTLHHNGWDARTANPNRFTTDRDLHNRFESAYVDAAIEIDNVRDRVRGPERLPDVMEAVKTYLAQAYAEVEAVYALEKAGEFNPDIPASRGSALIAAQLARAATMLSNLWYTAWLESSEPARPQR